MISLRFLKQSFALTLLSFVATSAYSQLAVYGAPVFTAYGYGTSGHVTLGSGSGGLMAGGFYNFPIQSRLTAGIDLRTSYSFGTRGGSFTGAALRIGFEPHRNRLRPYFELGGGVVSARGTNTYATVSNGLIPSGSTTNQNYTSGALELDFGLDIKLTDHFDIRAIDYGAAAGNTAGVGFLSAGIVYRVHPRMP